MKQFTLSILRSIRMPRRADLERMLIVSAAALVVVLALQGGDPGTATMVFDEAPVSAPQSDPQTPMTSTVCWYEDGSGYLVPVTRQIPQQEGVARATLALMVAGGENDLAAARMGLNNVIPEGVTFDLDISGGKARLDMSKEALSCASAEEELLMVQGAAAALCGFDSVEEVTFLFDGQKRSRLTQGTDVSAPFPASMINPESVATMAGSSSYADQVQLYFPSASGRMLVPVTRTVFSPADVTTAIIELSRGPRSDSGLEAAVPENCGVRSVQMKNGVCTIDFTSEFASVASASDGGQQALQAIVFTASRFPGVKKVSVTVDGKPFQAGPETAATFINQSDMITSSYPGVIPLD